MKKYTSHLLLALTVAGITGPTWAATSLKATVNGMVCAFCAQGIEKRLTQLPATQAVYVDLKRKVVAVQAKQGQTLDEQTIKAEITDAGYDVTHLEVVERSVAEIQADMKAEMKAPIKADSKPDPKGKP